MNMRFLVVTTEEGNALRLRALLTSEPGSENGIDWAPSLDDALRRLGHERFDLVIVEYILVNPEQFRALRSSAGQTPILTLHAEDDQDGPGQAMAHGASGFLLKDKYEQYLLRQTIDNLIGRGRAEVQCAMHRARAEVTLNSIGDAVISTRQDGSIDYLNEAASKITGWLVADAQGRPIQDVLQLINKNTGEFLPNPIETVLRTDKELRLPVGTILLRRDGSEAAIEDSSAPIRDAYGHLAGAVIVFHDVSEAQEMVKQISHLATHDFLTDLPNRAMLQDRIDQAVAHGQRAAQGFAVLYLDLDNFKHINDSLGHPIGDKLLCSVAKRLRGCVRATDTVSRQGGDEFVILIPIQESLDHAAIAAAKICNAMAQAHHIADHELYVTASIGISLYPHDGDDAITLIKNADTAMYMAKEMGRNNSQFFEVGMNQRAVERQRVESSLRHALDRKEFFLLYQPKIDLTTGAVTGAEALIRWEHPEWGTVSPDRFIRVAEDFGLIAPIGRWVLDEACRQAKHWQDEGMDIQTIAVNVSAVEFRRPEFIASLQQTMSRTGLAPHCLELEITESVLMDDAEGSRCILGRLKEMGIRLAVDDFGTGYSSLSYLKLFPIDVLKIDKAFVSGIGTADDDGSIANAVIAMGSSLKFRVVAEGVEDRAQFEFLRTHHCDEAQGFFFSKPLTSDLFKTMMQAGGEHWTN